MAQSDDISLRGFHVSGSARDTYEFDRDFFSYLGKAAIPDFHMARLFAQQMNRKRDIVAHPEQAVRASQINAMALIHGITHYVFRTYRDQFGNQLLQNALNSLHERYGTENVNQALDKFVREFPPLAVYLREMYPEDFLESITGTTTNRELILEELLLLWLSNANPAFTPFFELFGDEPLKRDTLYNNIVNGMYQFFQGKLNEEGGGTLTGGQNIIDFLLAPVRAAPNSLEGQLSFLLSSWSTLVGGFVYRLLRGMDFIKEEEFRPSFIGDGPPPSVVPTYDVAAIREFEFEAFTPDRDWMPRLVLIAKNAYVWLDQLTKKYGRPITKLDEIPDEELDKLARWGVTGLWLIGLWERSTASKKIKQMMGNPDAVASAYSLFDYQIATDLGGQVACDELRARAWKRGIRLASDMVPNHVGIDARWVTEHPDWFISLDYPPFPGYTFNGPDLSQDERVAIQIEDHYYDRTDASVVFKRTDRFTGSEKFIYHGNDGTTMPWNDTAQLNYLNPEVREAMIQTILFIARQFPVIRFDAAMTLVKRHFHRLWFPAPGSGGDIPSRAEHGMTRAQFDELMPEEFWREVVDRAAVEAPDTLLLAEAFWLMESYFVRTLGMHRVYNSAFMNMMRDEENGKYRLLMKNTLEFDPEILRRYVNFMNNPDEKTAVEQFDKGDKYFGVATILMTLPGLPMLGHGQIEGFSEKYGMEYRRAYYDETEDGYLIQRHEREIFPLARSRHLFAGVEHFLLYNFFDSSGLINEDVFAYSNRYIDDRSLVVYHNKYAQVRGWIHTSVEFSVKIGESDDRALVTRNLAEGLGLQYDADEYVIFRDQNAGLEYIRSSRELHERGLYIELGAYHYHVFVDFRIVMDNGSQEYARLASQLGGRGVASIDEALREAFLQPIHQPFKELVNAEMFSRLMEARVTAENPKPDTALLDEIEQKYVALLDAITAFIKPETDEETVDVQATVKIKPPSNTPEAIAKRVRAKLEAALELTTPEHRMLTAADSKGEALKFATENLAEDKAAWGGLFAWIFVQPLGKITGKDDSQQSRSWIDEWLLGRLISNAIQGTGVEVFEADQMVALVKAATSESELFGGSVNEKVEETLTTVLQDSDIQRFLRVNRHQDVLWLNKESLEQLLRWMLLVSVVQSSTMQKPTEKAVSARYKVVTQLLKAAETSGYQLDKMRALISAPAPKPKPTKAPKIDTDKLKRTKK